MAPVFKNILFILPLIAAQYAEAAKSKGLDAKIKALDRLYFGTATDRNTLSDPLQEAIVKAEFGQVTPENSMKWESTEPTRGNWTFSDADYLVKWAKKNKKVVRGHTLVWHSQLPQWVKDIKDPADLKKVMVNHVTTLAKRFKGIYAWDVVNEIFNDDGTYRSSVFYDVLGIDFVEIAFRAAHKADPKAKLYINDYNLDYAGPKVENLVKLVKELKAKGVPIHGIGSQAHLILNNGAIPYMHQPLKTLASAGVEVALTELDIRVPVPANNQTWVDQQEDYHTSVSACITVPQCVGVTAWGVSDKYSWVPDVFAGEGAALMWDEDFQKKTAYYGASEALEK